jgi:hypothetical protein
MNLAEIERFEGDQPVFDGIMQMAVFALAAGRVSRRLMGMVFRVAISWFQREPPS